MEIDDRAGHAEAEAGALAGRLGGVKGIENLGQLVLRNSGARVFDLDHDELVADTKRLGADVADIRADTRELLGGGPHAEGASPFHRVRRVGKEIDEDLANLRAIKFHERKIGL